MSEVIQPINLHEIGHRIGRVVYRVGLPVIGGISSGIAVRQAYESLRLSFTNVDQAVARSHGDIVCGAGLIFIGALIAYQAFAKYYLTPTVSEGNIANVPNSGQGTEVSSPIGN